MDVLQHQEMPWATAGQVSAYAIHPARGKKAKGVRFGSPCERQCIHQHTHNCGSTIKLQSEQSDLSDNMLSTRDVHITSIHKDSEHLALLMVYS